MSNSTRRVSAAPVTPDTRDKPVPRSFHQSQTPEPHHRRGRAILAAHPEVADLVGRNPWTLAIIIGVVAAQAGLAWALRAAAWWEILIASYVVGAFLTHALWAMIHESVHRRILKGTVANRLCGMLANLVMVVPTSTSFEKYHRQHHVHQGVYDLDADLPRHWEVKLFAGTIVGRLCWIMLFPILLMLRPLWVKKAKMWDRWMVVNVLAVAAADLLILMFWGPMAMLYLALSMLFALGLHPLGARWIQEHFTTNPGQETSSYYGALNAVQLNIGYHNEHHDCPGIPWNRLPDLRRAAPEFYDQVLDAHPSWSKLMIDFVVHGNPDVHGRVTRPTRKPKPVAQS